MEQDEPRVKSISEKIIGAEYLQDPQIGEIVFIGQRSLCGQIFALEGHQQWIHLYDAPLGISMGDSVIQTHRPPTLFIPSEPLRKMYDGKGRLLEISKKNPNIKNEEIRLYIPFEKTSFSLYQEKKKNIFQILDSLSETEILVYVGCGVMRQHIAEVKQILEDHDFFASKFLVISAPLSASALMRETSFFTGLTFAKYFQEKGYHPTLIFESFNLWEKARQEALQEKRSKVGESMIPDLLFPLVSHFLDQKTTSLKKQEDLKIINIQEESDHTFSV